MVSREELYEVIRTLAAEIVASQMERPGHGQEYLHHPWTDELIGDVVEPVTFRDGFVAGARCGLMHMARVIALGLFAAACVIVAHYS